MDIILYGPEANSQKRAQNIATAKGRCATKWIKDLNLFHISIYELNSNEKIESKTLKGGARYLCKRGTRGDCLVRLP